MNSIALNQEIRLDICKSPWEDAPYALISWWDMEQFSASAFVMLGTQLERLGVMHSPPLPSSISDAWFGEEATDRTGLVIFLNAVKDECAKVDLRFSGALLDRTIHQLQSGGLKNSDVTARLGEIGSRIQDEMRSCLFMHVTSEYAKYYGQQDLFGILVATNFPSASFDIKEAGNCLATERSTACVFHLMRILEIGLTALGKIFGISLAHTNWAPAIDQIESKVRDMHKDQAWRAIPDCKEQQEFYAQAASYLGVVKDAWRNYTAHARGKYTQEEAKLMLMNVKSFMEKISQRISE